MKSSESIVYMMAVRSRLNELYALSKVIDGVADDKDPNIRTLALQALEGIYRATRELTDKLSDLLLVMDKEGGEH